MNMPNIVRVYFDADGRNDADTLTAAFCEQGVVVDEGTRHEGRDAIRSWWVAAKQKCQYVTDPIEAAGDDSSIWVRARVSGQFPGSPVTLDYAFTTENGKINQLEII
ncbi:nuclear transport factor 2 family protein [Rhizobium laguerreae]|uniref:nuclear transport factor 2 family protein n=1 Tax=Rhizobium laguerreae TaxID=1076926 RepID=UPI00103F24F0|nr:nuclear transport factor 2 family protein [Rhizobium laguerreae]MBY3081059.1 nuclear transport factor 2 family protein [Rhizobium laguerreae]MBY3114959.1 nuclear transport factor 2 family protein [Rhizobium laguerreae]MBY3279841.1 nuclear transport factor 2 family protein [Rhizobium laguerreae]MBY3422464.1 nuclear transport factor 2 family protein [Rhizobium laguerreae]MBY3473390.1 nuclear transport factor 2 family protein [Rhizobium laguerreae]